MSLILLLLPCGLLDAAHLVTCMSVWPPTKDFASSSESLQLPLAPCWPANKLPEACLCCLLCLEWCACGAPATARQPPGLAPSCKNESKTHNAQNLHSPAGSGPVGFANL